MAPKEKSVQITLCSIIVFLFIITLFPIPRLFLLFFALSIALVIVIPVFIERLLDIVAMRRLRRLSRLTGEALQQLAVKEYRSFNGFIVLAALATLSVAIAGILLIEIFISEDSKEVFIGGVGILGIVLILIGLYFTIVMIRGFVVRLRRRAALIDETERLLKEEKTRAVEKI